MRKLFVSFTGLLYALRSGKVTFEDLQDGLFAFGCTREHAFSFGQAGEPDEYMLVFRNDVERKKIRSHLIEAFDRAEKDNRFASRTMLFDEMTYEVLNKLLVHNGFPALDLELLSDDRYSGCYYHYAEISDRIKAQGIPLKVVW